MYKKNKVVALGNKIKESKTHKKPDLKIFCPGMEYTPGLTIAVSDPDARKSKKDPKYEMCHVSSSQAQGSSLVTSDVYQWIAVAEAINVNPKNSTGLEFEVSLTSNKKDIVDCKYLLQQAQLSQAYKQPDKSPAPPKKTGHHRYVFTLLEGVNTNLRVPAERKNFGAGENGHGVQDWAKNQSLQVIGANWFLEKHETVYVGVPAIYRCSWSKVGC